MNQKIVVPDTSVLIRGTLSELIEKKKFAHTKIVIPRAVVDELQAQASQGREIGFDGLEEIKRLRALAEENKIILEFSGKRPTLEEIQLARKGRIDAIIRDVAGHLNATLITCDYVQALVGEAEGIPVEYIAHPELEKQLALESFFTDDTQSVHLKAGVIPMAKRGKPGQITLTEIRKAPLEEKELEGIINQIVLKARRDEDSFIEIGKRGSLVIQLGNYRIAVTRPPFSEAVEVTAVRPIAKLTLADYQLHAELEKRIVSSSPGILISGPPGSGKSTFAASIANFLAEKGKIVKTFEQPRDLQVNKEVTQYAPLEGSWESTADLLLLVRPDFTIFDEVRRTRDFHVFADMRLAGVGMIGVVHATNPMAAIQRMTTRLELGMIPHIVDTVIFIEAGRIRKVYELSLLVKVPSGMKEADLARPVVEIRNFENKQLEYEIYTYGEENVIIPVQETRSPVKDLAKKTVLSYFRRFDPTPQVEILGEDRIVVRVKTDMMGKLIGKQGKNIEAIEKDLGIHISLEPKELTLKGSIPWDYEESGAFINLKVDRKLVGKQVDVYAGEEFLFSPFVGKDGVVRIKKKSSLGRAVLQAVNAATLTVRG